MAKDISHLLPDGVANAMPENPGSVADESQMDVKSSSSATQKSRNRRKTKVVKRTYSKSKSPVWRSCSGSKTTEAGGRQLNLKIDAETGDRLDELIARYRCTATLVLTTALLDFLDEHEQ